MFFRRKLRKLHSGQLFVSSDDKFLKRSPAYSGLKGPNKLQKTRPVYLRRV